MKKLISRDIIQGDRRRNRRYDFELALRFYYTDHRGAVRVGSGVTIDLSRTGVRFQTEEPPPTGTRVEARISWPFLLQNTCPLELVMKGSVATIGQRGTVLLVNAYEFRTCGDRSFAEPTRHTGASRIA